MSPDESQLLIRAKECIKIEVNALNATMASLGQSFVDVVLEIERTLNANQKIIFSGIGKSAHVCEKLVGTFNSIGAPSCFIDPVRALHGDLGLCSENDLAILLSNSGQTDELIHLIPLLKRIGVSTVALTSQAKSTMTEYCDLTLLYQVPKEACPLSLAPTASTTAAMALGDALAMVLLEMRGLTREDFARFHPAGNLGRNLLKVTDIMRTGERFPILPDTSSLQEAILAMTNAHTGSIALIHPKTKDLTGILTDGDFRRSALSGPDFMNRSVQEFMTRNPVTIKDHCLAVDAINSFETHTINDLIVVNDANQPIGSIDNQDLPKMRLI
ncbi:MAG: KpsF/GutQ family sugar-phosphate isomerase [Opitutaceae bacterium]|nr:KpsF/GutQ family sugar-phosphate isomerase [Opitutaceae bacterium]